MSITYKLLVALYKANRRAGLAEKADIFFALGRISEAEYKKLMAMLGNDDDE